MLLDILSTVQGVRNILAVYDQATQDERAAGEEWYRDAHAFAGHLPAPTVSHGAGILAALSPSTNWEKNKIDALALCEMREAATVTTYGQNKVKALRILAGEYPENVLGGRKVLNFYGSILGYASAVCLDRHALSIALDRKMNEKDLERWYGLLTKNAKRYQKYIEMYMQAARAFGLFGYQMQAITWTAWRRIHGVK
jgi:hypothetical protein